MGLILPPPDVCSPLLNFSQGGFGPCRCCGGQRWALGEGCVCPCGKRSSTGGHLRPHHILALSWPTGRHEARADRARLGYGRCPRSSPGIFLGAGLLSQPRSPCPAVVAGCLLRVHMLALQRSGLIGVPCRSVPQFPLVVPPAFARHPERC